MAAIAAEFAGANFDARATDTIVQELWEKWVLIATLGGITSLMRAPVGDIERAGGAELALALLDECSAIAARARSCPASGTCSSAPAACSAKPGSTLTASMMKDIERGAPHRGGAHRRRPARAPPSADGETPLLRVVYAHLRTYEARRERRQRLQRVNGSGWSVELDVRIGPGHARVDALVPG